MHHAYRLLGLVLACFLTIGGTATAFAQNDEATPDAGATPTQASSERDVPQIGEAVTIYGEDGSELAAITVENVTDPFEEFGEFFTPEEGARYLAIDYTIKTLAENNRFEFSAFDLSVMTREGFLIGSAYVSLPEDSGTTILESQDVLGGESITGTLVFAVPEDAELNGAYYNGYGYLVQLADLSGGEAERPAVGDPVTTVNEDGEEAAQITITDYDEDFDEVDEYFTIDEGMRIIAVTVAIENLIPNDRYEVSPYDFALQTEEGFLLSPSYVSLPEESDIVALEDSDILGGESLEGTVFFVLPESVAVGGLYFTPETGLVFLIGNPAI